MKGDTRLDDNASIYQKREQKSEKQKLSEMNFQEKLSYFKDYYMKKVIVIVLVGAMLISVAYTMLRDIPTNVLNVAILNNFFTQEYLDELTADATEMFITEPDDQEIFFDTEYFFSAGDYAGGMKLMTRVYAEELDVIIARESEYRQHAANGTMLDFSEVYTKEQLEKLGDKVAILPMYMEAENTLDKEIAGYYPLGIYLHNLDDYYGYDLSADPLVIGIVVNAPNKENAVKFVEYMLGK